MLKGRPTDRLRQCFALAGILCAVVGIGASGQPVVLDQSQLYWTATRQTSPSGRIAQTFTPGMDGMLDHIAVSILFRDPALAGYPIRLDVVETVNGRPEGYVLGSVVRTEFATPDFLFLDRGIYLQSNTLYGFVLSTEAPEPVDFGSSWEGDQYKRGVLWEKVLTNDWHVVIDGAAEGQSDLVFQTFMGPRPLTVWLVSPRKDARFPHGQPVPLESRTALMVSNAQVTYYGDGTLLGTASDAPYQFTWTGADYGSRIVTAVLSSGGNLVATSPPVPITITGNGPLNDEFVDRSFIYTYYLTRGGSNVNATVEPGEPVHRAGADGASIWWKWSAPATGPVLVTTKHSATTNLVVAVYRGSEVNGLVRLADGDRETTFDAQIGREYEIAVDSVGGTAAGIVLDLAASDLSITSPTNDGIFSGSAPVTLTAVAIFVGRVIRRVEFVENGTVLATATNAPYAAVRTNFSSGLHSVVARAVDTRDLTTYSLPVRFIVRPGNDAFGFPVPLSGYSADGSGSNLGATRDPGDFHWADNIGGHTVWYSWTAPEAGICALTGSGIPSGTLFTVYLARGTNTNPALGSMIPLSGGVDTVTFHAEAGAHYRILVDGYLGDEGTFTFQLRLTPPNDRLVDAIQIAGEYHSAIATLRGATRETGEPAHGGLTSGRSVWWNWTSPASARVRWTCVATNFQPVLAAYTGFSMTNLALVASTNGSPANAATLILNAEAGVTYLLVVDGSDPEAARFSLELEMDLLRVTAPLDGQIFPHPVSLQLSAQVPPAIPGISVIEFFDRDGRIGAVTNSPFDLLWENIPAGAHAVTAQGLGADGHTNVSLPVKFLVYTNNETPKPMLAAWTYTSFVIDALGQLYVFGRNGVGHFGLSVNPLDPECEDPFEPICVPIAEYLWTPQLAKFPPGVTEWRAIGGTAFAMGNDGGLYHVGTNRFEPAPPATSWALLRNDFMIDNLGRLYYEGRLRVPNGPYPWVDVAGAYSLNTNRELYQFTGTDYVRIPFPPGVTSWRTIVAGGSHVLALGSDRELYSWGLNYSGQLGLGDYVDRATPTRVPRPAGVTNWVVIACGGNHSLAIADNGQLYGWGRNWENQLALGYTTIRTVSRPTRLSPPIGVTKWTTVAGGAGHTLAIGDDCQLYAWGDGRAGQLGVGEGPPVPYPLRVPGIGALCGIAVILPGNSTRLPNGNFVIEFLSDLSRTYAIQYSADMQNWITAFASILGTGDKIQWIDDGPPKTVSTPSSEPSRFYRVIGVR